MPHTHQVLPLPIGNFIVWANNAHTVGIRTEWEHNRREHGYLGGVPDVETVNETVRLSRVDYSVRIFLRRVDTWRKETAADRSFNERRIVPIEGTAWAYDLYDYALGRKDDSTNHGSAAARTAAIEKIAVPYAHWLETPQGKLFVEVGEIDDRAQVEAALDKNLEVLETAVRHLLRIKARLAQGRPISQAEKSFARYVRLTNNLGDK
jgi:hypothetical protein